MRRRGSLLTNLPLAAAPPLPLLLLLLLLLSLARVCQCAGSGDWLQLHNMDTPGPYFDPSVASNVSTVAGRGAQLPCRVHQLHEQTVSWIRKKDLTILSLNSFSYTSDARFHVNHTEGSADYTLYIEHVMSGDSGVYECQVSTEPKRSWPVTLTVRVAKAIIAGMQHQFVKPRSRLQLGCRLTARADPPVTLRWLKNGRRLHVGDTSGGAALGIESERTVSASSTRLVVASASATDTGNYTCVPSEGVPAWVQVHVIDGDSPEAMQAAVTSHTDSLWCMLVCVFVSISAANIISQQSTYYILYA